MEFSASVSSLSAIFTVQVDISREEGERCLFQSPSLDLMNKPLPPSLLLQATLLLGSLVFLVPPSPQSKRGVKEGDP